MPSFQKRRERPPGKFLTERSNVLRTFYPRTRQLQAVVYRSRLHPLARYLSTELSPRAIVNSADGGGVQPLWYWPFDISNSSSLLQLEFRFASSNLTPFRGCRRDVKRTHSSTNANKLSVVVQVNPLRGFFGNFVKL